MSLPRLNILLGIINIWIYSIVGDSIHLLIGLLCTAVGLLVINEKR